MSLPVNGIRVSNYRPVSGAKQTGNRAAEAARARTFLGPRDPPTQGPRAQPGAGKMPAVPGNVSRETNGVAGQALFRHTSGPALADGPGIHPRFARQYVQ